MVKVGDIVGVGGLLGTSQDLTEIYEGITPHFHFEVKCNGAVLNPIQYLRSVKS